MTVPHRQARVAIVGAGMSGLCAAVALGSVGVHDVVVYEKASALGGTWRDNTYPGLTCDVPSRFYQYTFDTNPGWSRLFSPGNEIQAYLTSVAQRHHVTEKIRFDTAVVAARFTDPGWHLTASDGTETNVDFLISAAGVLREPRIPHIPGLDAFGGNAFHSARWDHGVTLFGSRVAVIGTGSTGVQIVTALAGTPAKLSMFQRTPSWVVPAPNPRYLRATRALHSRMPWLDLAAYHTYRAAFEFLAVGLVRPGWRRRLIGAICRANLRTVRDPALRRELTPTYDPMCKRLVMSGGFYRAVQHDDVDLVTAAIHHVDRTGIVTTDGRHHDADVIVLATGFDAHAYMRPMDLVGRDGLDIADAWASGPRAHQTVTIPGFPNFFMMMGPHSPVGNYALTAIAESQAAHIATWIRAWQRTEFDTIEARDDATEAYNAGLTSAMPGTVWTSGCDSWYLGSDGLPEVWPHTPDRHRAMLAAPTMTDYHLGVVDAIR